MKLQDNPLRFDFSWDWDWSAGGYTVYRKLPGDAVWGDTIGLLPWGATSFTDDEVESGVAYEYAFYKKEFEKIVDTIDIPVNETLVFSFENVYGDGLCCNFGFGWYKVEVCGIEVASGSDFGFIQSDTFTVCDDANITVPMVLTIQPDMMVNNSWWSLKDTSGVELASSGTPGTWLDDRPKYGYIFAGKELPPVENRGSILLLVDDAYSVPLLPEIGQLETDLRADGWKVIKQEVNREDSVELVKSLIVNVFQDVDDLKMVYLLGHIPVPYAGDIYPDGHIESHRGAWPADVYYGDIDGVFTDSVVSDITAFFPRNHNVPGDGKFDQSAIPSKVELAIGRVDLFDMPSFGNDDVELTRRYLSKAHLWKSGQRTVKRRALVDDNLNVVLGSPAASGWRNFAPMFTADSVFSIDYFSNMKSESYLWSFGSGSGTHQSANGIGTTQDFANDTLQNIFTMLIGSQFGDWDNPDNFLRAPLASPSWTLSNCWAGNPPYVFHKMAMGSTLGDGLLDTQNATEDDYYPGPALVHTSLLGDPSLRLHPVKMPDSLNLSTLDESVELAWQAAENEDVTGYFIYRLDSLTGEFIRLNSSPVSDTFYSDILPPDGLRTYMVRTLKLEHSGSGSYWNLSLGIMDTVTFKYISPVGVASPASSVIKIYPNPGSGKITVDFPKSWGKTVVTIIGISGETLGREFLLSGSSLDLSDLPGQVFILKLVSPSGHAVLSEKVIVNN